MEALMALIRTCVCSQRPALLMHMRAPVALQQMSNAGTHEHGKNIGKLLKTCQRPLNHVRKTLLKIVLACSDFALHYMHCSRTTERSHYWHSYHDSCMHVMILCYCMHICMHEASRRCAWTILCIRAAWLKCSDKVALQLLSGTVKHLALA